MEPDKMRVVIESDPRSPALTKVLINGREVWVTRWKVHQEVTHPTRVEFEMMPEEVEVRRPG